MRKIGITYTMYKTAEEGGKKTEGYIELPVSDEVFAATMEKSYEEGRVTLAETMIMIATLQGYYLDRIETIEAAVVE